MKRETDSTIGRIYKPELLLSIDIIKAIFERFRYDIPAIFGDNLAFGCIVGGFAKGYAVSDQDVDMFVCLREIDEDKVKLYRDFYFTIHEEFDLVPDRGKPGEIMTLGRLFQKIALINHRSLRGKIESYYEYEGLLWTEMLTGPKAAVVGDLTILNKVQEECELLPQKWRKEVYHLMGPKINEELAKLPIQRLIKAARKMGIIEYQKIGKGLANNITEAYKDYSNE